MRLLHVISSMDPRGGGPSQGIRNLTPYTIQQGNTVEVVCLDEPNSPYLARECFRVHALGSGRGSWAYHPALRPWLNKNLRRFDAVLLNGLWQFPGYSLLKLAECPQTPPYFVFPHGMLDPWFQRTPGRRLKAVRNWLYWKFIEQHVIHQAKAVFFTCGEEMRLAGGTFHPYQPRHQVNVGFGVASPSEYHEGMKEAFAQKHPGLKGNPYFLFLGRLHPKKGVDILIKAYSSFCRLLSEAGQPLPLKLVIAGPGLETPYGRQMQELASQTCPTGSVFWTGMLTGEAKWGALYHADAFVLPSHQENFGIAVVEALACGKPVLISNQINIWREIEEDGAGLVGPDTLAGMTDIFARWRNLSLEERVLMEKAAKLCYKNRFCIDIAAENLLTNIEELTGRSRDQGLHSTREITMRG